jgi:hypothetical protein
MPDDVTSLAEKVRDLEAQFAELASRIPNLERTVGNSSSTRSVFQKLADLEQKLR